MIKKSVMILFLVLFLLPLASAQFSVNLEKNKIDGAMDGESINIPAHIENTGQCKMDCYYNRGGGVKQEVINGLKPSQIYNFEIDFQVHLCSKEPCEGYIDFTCKEQADGKSCFGKEYKQTAVIKLINIKTNPEMKAPLQDQSSAAESTPESSGFNADHVGEFIGLAFVIIVAVIFFILLIFGFYKLIRFLFFRKEKEEKERKEEGKRKLSAIMFTDMKGYSAEMNRDEEATLKKLWRYEKAMKSIVKEHDGRVVKTIGDAIMGDFSSAVNAVKASLEIQRLLKKEDIKIRIGIHLGDVIHKGGDIFGDGVNIASRIESICEPGEIYISEDVYSQVKGKIHVNFENLGNRPLKNIESPPRVYRIK